MRHPRERRRVTPREAYLIRVHGVDGVDSPVEALVERGFGDVVHVDDVPNSTICEERAGGDRSAASGAGRSRRRGSRKREKHGVARAAQRTR